MEPHLRVLYRIVAVEQRHVMALESRSVVFIPIRRGSHSEA